MNQTKENKTSEFKENRAKKGERNVISIWEKLPYQHQYLKRLCCAQRFNYFVKNYAYDKADQEAEAEAEKKYN